MADARHTLLIDGNSLFNRSYYASENMFNQKGSHIGGIFQFITTLRNLLDGGKYQKVFIFWDGKDSNDLKREIYPDYKKQRDNRTKNKGLLTEEDHSLERFIIKEYLEELFVRQFEYDETEADDLIGYYVTNKGENEHITICSSDRDLCQLVKKDEVVIYLFDKKEYIDYDRFYDEFGHIPENDILIKIIKGDNSDNIKGIKGLGEKTIYKHFPEIRDTPLSFDDLMRKAAKIQVKRHENKKKELKSLNHLIGAKSDGLYQRNKKIMDLKEPIIPEHVVRDLNENIHLPLDPEDRDLRNLYEKFRRDGLDTLLRDRYVDFLMPFKRLIEREKRLIV